MNIFNKIKYENITELLIYLIGLTCSFGALKFGGFSLYNYLLIILTIIFLWEGMSNKRNLYVRKGSLIIVLFGFGLIISLLINLGSLPTAQIKESSLFVLKILLFIYPLFLLSNTDQLSRYSNIFMKGLKIACYVQLYWSFAQIMLYHLAGISLNELVFVRMLHVSVEGAAWTNVTGIGIRPSGLSWETANLAIILVMGFVLTDNKINKFSFVLGILLSTSSTGYISLAIVILYDLLSTRYKGNFTLRKLKTGKFLGRITILAVLLIFIVVFNKKILQFASVGASYATMMIGRLSTNFSGNSNETSFNIHKSYYMNLPKIIESQNIIKTIFGNGTLAAGKVYYDQFGLYTNQGWNPESDFITIFVGNGIYEIIMYYSLIVRAFINNMQKNRKILIVISFAGLFYLYFRGTWIFLVILMLYSTDKNSLKVNK